MSPRCHSVPGWATWVVIGWRAREIGWMLRVTQYDRGGDIHGEHVEPDIPGVRSAVRVHGDAKVLTVSRCAAPVTQWWSWSVTRPGCRHDSARAGGRCSADPGGREVAGQAEAPQQRPQVRPAKPIAGVGGVRGRGNRVQRVMQRRGVRAGSAGSVPPITPSWNIAKQRISSARQRRRRSQPRTVATGTPRSAPIRTQPAPPSAAARPVAYHLQGIGTPGRTPRRQQDVRTVAGAAAGPVWPQPCGRAAEQPDHPFPAVALPGQPAGAAGWAGQQAARQIGGGGSGIGAQQHGRPSRTQWPRCLADTGKTERRQPRRSPGSARGMGHAATLRPARRSG